MSEQKPAVERVHPPDRLMRLVNPITKRLLKRGRGRLGERVLILHFTGSRTGRKYSTPVGYRSSTGAQLC
jgi:hypothetical protein